MRSTFSLLLLWFCIACSPIQHIGIQTYNPAEITFPDEVKKILIVNNALPQPADTGYEYNLFGVAQDTCRAQADSALLEFCKALGEAIVESNYFEDVLLYHDPVRTGGTFYSDQKLTQEQVQALCIENGVEAVVSLDRLLFQMNKNVVAFADGYLLGYVNVDMRGIVRAYLPYRETPFTTVLAHDSLSWMDEAADIKLLNHYLPAPDEALKIAAGYLGSRLYTNYVPHWQDESRWFYNGTTTKWKEASAYANSERWEQAYQRWSNLYEQSSGWKQKAKAASNIALYLEVKGNFTEALEWATRSYELFEKNTGSNDNYTALQKAYKEALEQRVLSDRKLNIQFGE